VFASYSHRDTDIVRAVAAFAELIGDEYYVDAFTLRSGEKWEQRLQKLIDDADLFQLFWSSNAMRSEPVLREVEHALSLHREGFIRPVRWEEPLPTDEQRGLPPAEVLELHFSWLPNLSRVPPSGRPPENLPDLDSTVAGPPLTPADPVAPGARLPMGPPHGPPRSSSGSSMIALVLGIVGIFVPVVSGTAAFEAAFEPAEDGIGLSWLMFGVPSVLAVVFGHVGLSRAGRGMGPGRGMAIAGLALGYLSILLMLVIAFS
jgi:hypothetical protein